MTIEKQSEEILADRTSWLCETLFENKECKGNNDFHCLWILTNSFKVWFKWSLHWFSRLTECSSLTFFSNHSINYSLGRLNFPLILIWTKSSFSPISRFPHIRSYWVSTHLWFRSTYPIWGVNWSFDPMDDQIN